MILGTCVHAMLLILCALLAIYAYSVYYLGQPSVHAGILLVWRGKTPPYVFIGMKRHEAMKVQARF